MEFLLTLLEIGGEEETFEADLKKLDSIMGRAHLGRAVGSAQGGFKVDYSFGLSLDFKGIIELQKKLQRASKTKFPNSKFGTAGLITGKQLRVRLSFAGK